MLSKQSYDYEVFVINVYFLKCLIIIASVYLWTLSTIVWTLTLSHAIEVVIVFETFLEIICHGRFLLKICKNAIIFYLQFDFIFFMDSSIKILKR